MHLLYFQGLLPDFASDIYIYDITSDIYSTQNESKLINLLKFADQNQILDFFPYKETYEIL